MNYGICAVVGYLFGCLNAAYLIGRLKGVDIREKGSHNPGASNTTIVLGWRFGVLVAAVDILKAVAAVAVCRYLLPGFAEAGLIAGIACVLGHMFPVTLGFRGGKGLASYVGMMLGLSWRSALVFILLAVAITLIFDYIAYSTLFTAAAYPLWLWYGGAGLVPMLLLAAVAVVILVKHLENLRRIARGEETGLRKVPMGKRT